MTTLQTKDDFEKHLCEKIETAEKLFLRENWDNITIDGVEPSPSDPDDTDDGYDLEVSDPVDEEVTDYRGDLVGVERKVNFTCYTLCPSAVALAFNFLDENNECSHGGITRIEPPDGGFAPCVVHGEYAVWVSKEKDTAQYHMGWPVKV